MSNLIQADELLSRAGDPALRIVDARFDLADPDAGRRRYAEGHLPGAIYLHLDEDLSGPLRPDGIGGRHPLPDPDALARRLSAAGIGDDHDVVAYDDAGGAFAARVWWLLRWIGHARVQILDGGVEAWRAAGGELARHARSWPAARHGARPDASLVVSAETVAARLEDPATRIVDARAPERYRGEVEPLDRKAGHVPGALSRPFAGNLAGGRFLAPEALRARFAALEGADEVVVYCGSGVTAAHDVLAIEEAGLGMPTLYAGSWSDWSSRDEMPVATGDEAGDEVGDEAGAHPPHRDGA